MNLRELQSRFLQDIMLPQSVRADYVMPGEKLSSTQKVALYQDAYRLRLLEALSDDYPVLHTIAGDELFQLIAEKYIEQFPSQHFSIRYFGQFMPDFLREEKNLDKTGILNEIALFELQLRNAFDGPDINLLGREDVMQTPAEHWPDFIFKLIPAFSNVQFNWNIPQLWQAANEETQTVEPVKLEQSQHWIIWRPELQTNYRSVSNEEAFALQLLQERICFSDFCAALSEYGLDEPAVRAAQFISCWLADSLLMK